MYRPNFCCSCGERILREKWRPWTSRRYCDACAKILQKPQVIAPFLLGFVLLSAGIIIGRRIQPAEPPLVEKNSLVTLTSAPGTNKKTKENIKTEERANVSNQTQTNSNVQPDNSSIEPSKSSQSAKPSQSTYYCGAETKKGTPCQRKVRGPVRCWQHEGKPPMMPQEKLLIRE